MMLLRFHVWYLPTCDISCDSYRAAAVHDFAAAAAVLKRVEMFADLSVVSVRVDRLILVEARNWSHLLLHHVLCLDLRVLRMVVLMAINDYRRSSIVLLIMSDVNIRPYRSLRVVMVISSAVKHQKNR